MVANSKATSVALALLTICVALWFFKSWGIVHYVSGAFSSHAPSPYADRSDDIRLAPAHLPSQGEAILLHGLNFEAEKMSDLGRIFQNLNLDVFIPRLAGHRGNLDETKINPMDMWREQVANWNFRARHPLTCVGYSLGGLLIVERYLSGHLNCDRFVLFAPALAVQMPTVLSTWFDLFVPYSLVVPSAIPNGYRHFDKVGLGPTLAVPQIIESLKNLMPERNERKIPPGVVFMDPNDNVVDSGQVSELLKAHFQNWRLVPVQTENLNENHAHHLIVDEVHLGAEQWQRVIRDIEELMTENQ